MSSYFDAKSFAVSEAARQTVSAEDFIYQVADIERRLIEDVTLVVGDREFPSDLREKAMSLIARWHVGEHAGLQPTGEALEHIEVLRMSELVEEMHNLFHEVAQRRILTRFGMLDDHPKSILDRREEHDNERAAASWERRKI